MVFLLCPSYDMHKVNGLRDKVFLKSVLFSACVNCLVFPFTFMVNVVFMRLLTTFSVVQVEVDFFFLVLQKI